MAKYICKRCGYEASQKQNYINHLNRKNECPVKYENKSIEDLKRDLGILEIKEPLAQNEIINHTVPTCKKCNKTFSQYSSLYRHVRNVCNKTKTTSNVKVAEIEKDIKQLKKDTQKIANSITNETKSNRSKIPARLKESQVRYVYLIREREFARLNEPVYKIGKSYEQKYARLDKYPKWSEIISIMEVSDEDKIEKIMIKEFSEKFTKSKYGNEYFEGDRLEIKREFNRIVVEEDWNK